MNKTLKVFFVMLLAFLPGILLAQVIIGDGAGPPDPSAGLEVRSPSQGILAPRVALQSLSDPTPVQSPASGLVVFNTTVSGTQPDQVVPGYYLWNGTRWQAIAPPPGNTTGDMLYWNGSQWGRIPAGMPGQYLTMTEGNIPSWTGIAYPEVVTNEAWNLGTADADIGGEVISDGGAEVTSRGICYSTDPEPTLDDLYQTMGFGTGAFTLHISGLYDNTLYHARAFATNSMGTTYGNEVTFTTPLNLTGPAVITSPVTDITQTSAVCVGNVTADGGSPVTDRGICWSTTGTPDIAGNHSVDGSGTGIFTHPLTSLSPGVTYYIRAYATNYIATNYGAVVTFTTFKPYPPNICPGTPEVTYGNRTYYTVKIGNQCWLRENLNIGARIDGASHMTNNGIIQKHCYEDDPANCITYGGLYEWGEAMNYQNGATDTSSWNPVPSGPVQGICPNGWHIPTLGEWSELSLHLGDDSISGTKMKETGTEHWGWPNTGATNSSLFTGLPSGYGWEYYYDYQEIYGYFWTASEYSPTKAFDRTLCFLYKTLDMLPNYKLLAMPVRCLKDTVTPAFPSIFTMAASNIQINTATAGGNIITSGGAEVTARGICWSTNPYPGLSDPHSVNGTGTGIFTGNLVNLQPLTQYYVRAYATNIAGTAYGDQKVFITGNTPGGVPCPGIPTVSYGGMTYHTVQIGSQCWLQENLNIGTRIEGYYSQLNNGIIEKYCPENLESNCTLYGGLYQWGEVVQYLNGASNITDWDPVPSQPVTGLCPSGWHIPTDAEWCTLAKTLDNTFDCNETDSNPWKIAGMLREAGTARWNYPNPGATNSSGFTAVGAGMRYVSTEIINLGYEAEFWTSTTAPENNTEIWYMLYWYDKLIHGPFGYRPLGLSVRCIKD